MIIFLHRFFAIKIYIYSIILENKMQNHKLKLYDFEFPYPDSYNDPVRELFVASNPVVVPDTSINNVINYLQDMSNNLHYYNKVLKPKVFQDPNDPTKDNPDDILDRTGYLKFNPTLVEAAKEDTQSMLIQQNSMYIIGLITTATLLITAIMISR